MTPPLLKENLPKVLDSKSKVGGWAYFQTIYIEGPRIGLRLKVGKWANFRSDSKWGVGTGDGLTFEYGLTIKDLRYTHSGAYPDIFERRGPINLNFL